MCFVYVAVYLRVCIKYIFVELKVPSPSLIEKLKIDNMNEAQVCVLCAMYMYRHLLRDRIFINAVV